MFKKKPLKTIYDQTINVGRNDTVVVTDNRDGRDEKLFEKTYDKAATLRVHLEDDDYEEKA